MYPVSYEADAAIEGRNRLTTFFRYFVAIPWVIVAALYGFAASIAAFIAWFALVFTGRYPEGLYNFNAGFLRFITRTNGFCWLLTDGVIRRVSWLRPLFGLKRVAVQRRVEGVPPAANTGIA